MINFASVKKHLSRRWRQILGQNCVYRLWRKHDFLLCMFYMNIGGIRKSIILWLEGFHRTTLLKVTTQSAITYPSQWPSMSSCQFSKITLVQQKRIKHINKFFVIIHRKKARFKTSRSKFRYERVLKHANMDHHI